MKNQIKKNHKHILNKVYNLIKDLGFSQEELYTRLLYASIAFYHIKVNTILKHFDLQEWQSHEINTIYEIIKKGI